MARERNFTRAAQILHIAQPPLSRQIQQLEDELGVTLIERGSRPLRLTDAGRLLFEQAVQLLERVEEMKAITQRLNEAERPRFRIGFVSSTLYGRLPELIRRYRAVRPGVELTLLELTTFEQIAALKEGCIDVGYGRIPFDDPAIERILLRNEKLSTALPSGRSLLARARPLRLDDLAAEPLVVYPKSPSRFTAVCRRQSANDISTALHKMPIPALATITFKRPKRRSVASTRPALLEADIVVQEDRVVAGTADLVHQVSASGIVQVGDHHLRAFTRQCRRTCCADA